MLALFYRVWDLKWILVRLYNSKSVCFLFNNDTVEYAMCILQLSLGKVLSSVKAGKDKIIVIMS